MTFSSAFKRSALLSLSASAVLATGCANMATTATSVTSDAGTATMTGKIYGGNQPVVNADVRLYQAGSTGYGSQGTLYATTTTDTNGNFSFSQQAGVGSSQSGTKVYSCPTTGNPQMYIIARGGSTQGTGNGTNSAAAFIVALGPCSGISTAVVDMTETTTVATLAALQQYFGPASSTTSGLNQLGYPATTQAAQGFQNAYSMIANLVNVRTGVVGATTVTATPAGSTAAVSVTATPEINKINTLANILAACVNTTASTSANCTTLFNNAIPPNSALTSQPALNFVTATDTLGALYFMLTNPTSGSATSLNNLFALQPGTAAPFLPDETSAPTDWTVGLNYASTSACSDAGANFLAYVYHIAIDATGNAWAVSNATGGNVFGVGPNGAPVACVLGTTLGKSNTLAIDASNNVWVGGTANLNLYKIPAGTPTSMTTWPTGESTAQGGTQVIAVDGSGNVSFTPYNLGADLYQFTGAANSAAPTPAVLISTALGASPYYMAADTKNRLFVADSATTTSLLYDAYPSTGTGNTGGYVTANVATSANAIYGQGVAAGLAGTIDLVNGSTTTAPGNTISIFTPSATGTATATTSATFAGGLASGREVAVDGAGNVWSASLTKTTTNYASGATTAGLYELNELTTSGAAISPNGTGTTTATINGGFQKDLNVLPNAPRGVAIDLSGNVWTGSGSSTSTSITVLVGAAVPVVTPIASGLAAGVTSGNATQKP